MSKLTEAKRVFWNRIIITPQHHSVVLLLDIVSGNSAFQVLQYLPLPGRLHGVQEGSAPNEAVACRPDAGGEHGTFSPALCCCPALGLPSTHHHHVLKKAVRK